MSRTIEDVVESYGFWGHGGDVAAVAAEWTAEGFTAAEADAWLDADVCWPADAREYTDKGWTPDNWTEHSDNWMSDWERY